MKEALITISRGQIQGTTVKLADGSEILAWFGVYYGKEPKKFEKAQAIGSHNGIFDATVVPSVRRPSQL